MRESDLALGAKRRDYWFTVLFVDPLVLPVVRFLAKRPRPTPDQISVVAFTLALAIGPLFALGTRTGLIAGAIAFYVCFFVDCIDGKLARATGITSARGGALDKLGDGARRASASLGLILGIWRNDAYQSADVLWVAAYVVLAYYFIELSGAEAPLEKTTGEYQPAGRWDAFAARYRLLPTPGMPDVQALVFIAGPLTGFVVPAAIVGGCMAVAGLLLNARRRLA